MVIGMHTQRAAARRAEKEIATVWDQDNQVPPLEEIAISDQVPNAPPPMIDRIIGTSFLTLTQSMTSQSNVVTGQVQAIMTQMNREVGPWVPQHANTMPCVRAS